MQKLPMQLQGFGNFNRKRVKMMIIYHAGLFLKYFQQANFEFKFKSLTTDITKLKLK